jgi:hypothetical protein
MRLLDEWRAWLDGRRKLDAGGELRVRPGDPRSSFDASRASWASNTERVCLDDLVQLRKIEPCRDGRRLLFRRADLDAYLRAVE